MHTRCWVQNQEGAEPGMTRLGSSPWKPEGTFPKLAQGAGQCGGGETDRQLWAGVGWWRTLNWEGISPSGLRWLHGGEGQVPGVHCPGMDLSQIGKISQHPKGRKRIQAGASAVWGSRLGICVRSRARGSATAWASADSGEMWPPVIPSVLQRWGGCSSEGQSCWWQSRKNLSGQPPPAPHPLPSWFGPLP